MEETDGVGLEDIGVLEDEVVGVDDGRVGVLVGEEELGQGLEGVAGQGATRPGEDATGKYDLPGSLVGVLDFGGEESQVGGDQGQEFIQGDSTYWAKRPGIEGQWRRRWRG